MVHDFREIPHYSDKPWGTVVPIGADPSWVGWYCLCGGWVAEYRQGNAGRVVMAEREAAVESFIAHLKRMG